MALTPYMRRYFIRLASFMTAYAAVLIGGLTVKMAGAPLSVRALLALTTAAMICGVFWTIFRLIEECDDEYQRMLFVRQTLLATALTLVSTTIWQFLKVYGVLVDGPEWIGVIWFVMWGLAAPAVRWRA
jgi:hypothetical protein